MLSRPKTKRQYGIAVLVGLLALIFLSMVILPLSSYKLFYVNHTHSAPIGIYMHIPSRHLSYGDYVLASLPQDVETSEGLVHKGYFIIKKVRGMPGDTYIVADNQLFIADYTAPIFTVKGYPITRTSHLPQLKNGKYIVPNNTYLLLNAPEESLDSRYLGPVSTDNIHGRLINIINYDAINKWLLAHFLYFLTENSTE